LNEIFSVNLKFFEVIPAISLRFFGISTAPADPEELHSLFTEDPVGFDNQALGKK
jgi:hypothetical protein